MKRKGGGWFNPILMTTASGVHKLVVRAHQQHHGRERQGGVEKDNKNKVAFTVVRPVEVLH